MLDAIHARRQITKIISGGAVGADSLGARWAENNGIEKIIYLPDWNTHGKKAGFLRNIQIVESSDAIVAFWDGKSRGTQHSISEAKARNIPVFVVLGKSNRTY